MGECGWQGLALITFDAQALKVYIIIHKGAWTPWDYVVSTRRNGDVYPRTEGVTLQRKRGRRHGVVTVSEKWDVRNGRRVTCILSNVFDVTVGTGSPGKTIPTLDVVRTHRFERQPRPRASTPENKRHTVPSSLSERVLHQTPV